MCTCSQAYCQPDFTSIRIWLQVLHYQKEGTTNFFFSIVVVIHENHDPKNAALYELCIYLKYVSVMIQDQMRAIDMIRNDPELANLRIIEAALVDLEIRGVPALKFMGDIVWR